MSTRPSVRFLRLAAVLAVAGAPAAVSGQEAPGHVTVRQHGAAFLGIRLDVFAVPPGTPGSIDGRRLVVMDLYRGGPADDAGLEPGDVVVRVNNAPATYEVFQRTVSGQQPGVPLGLHVLRGNRILELSVTPTGGPDRSVLIPLADADVQVRLDSARVEFAKRLETLRTGELRRLVSEASILEAVPQVNVLRARPDSVSTVVFLRRSDGSVQRLDSLAGEASSYRFRFETRGDSLHATAEIVLEGARDRARTELVRVAPENVRWRPLAIYAEGANRVAGAQLERVDAQVLAGVFGADGGLLVVDVAEGTPARLAGLLPGDVVHRVGSVELTTIGQLRSLLARRGGDSTVLGVVRRGQPVEVILPR